MSGNDPVSSSAKNTRDQIVSATRQTTSTRRRPQRSDIAATQPATISQITEAARIAQMTAFLFRCRILVVYDKEYVMTMYPIAFGATNVPAARITWRQLVRSTSATGVRLSFCAASALRN